MKTDLTCMFAAALITGGFTATLFAAEKETTITMNQVPAVVKEAVKSYASETEIKSVEDSDVDGIKVIEFDVNKNGKGNL